MKILVPCEESQAVTIQFRLRGHEAFSCNTEPCSGGHPEWHLQQDAVPLLKQEWDMIIAFPPCTYLTFTATRHWNAPGRKEKRERAFEFFMLFINADCFKIAVENPVGYPNVAYRKPDQIIHPYYFGDPMQKRTCLWLKNLKPLKYLKNDTLFEKKTALPKPEPLYICQGEKCKGKKINWCEGYRGGNRAKNRSKTFPGIARAMAEQWGVI